MINSQYLKHVFSTSLILLITIGLFNYLINPFSIIDVSRITGINEIKPQSAHRISIFKKYQPIYYQPKTLLVGNSRVEMGLNPNHNAFQKFQPVYNLGVPGPAVRGQLSYAQNVIDKSNVNTIILSLDYRDFLDQQKSVNSEILQIEANEIKDKISAVLSLDSLQASVITLFNQNNNAPNRLINGFNPANEYREILKIEGQDTLFKHQLNALNIKLRGKVHDPKKIQREISILNKKITEWMSSDIEVMLFINPYQRDYYTTLDTHKLLASFNHWRELIAQNFSNKVKFCDFTLLGYEKSNDMSVDKTLKYFWEPTHYKKELGDIMIPMILKGCTVTVAG